METKTSVIEQEFIQTRDVMELAKVSSVTIWRWVGKGILPKPTKVGHLNYFKKQDIMDVFNHGKTFKV